MRFRCADGSAALQLTFFVFSTVQKISRFSQQVRPQILDVVHTGVVALPCRGHVRHTVVIEKMCARLKVQWVPAEMLPHAGSAQHIGGKYPGHARSSSSSDGDEAVPNPALLVRYLRIHFSGTGRGKAPRCGYPGKAVPPRKSTASRFSLRNKSAAVYPPYIFRFAPTSSYPLRKI